MTIAIDKIEELIAEANIILAKIKERIESHDFVCTFDFENSHRYNNLEPINFKDDLEWKRLDAKLRRQFVSSDFQKQIERIIDSHIIDENSVNDLLICLEEIKEKAIETDSNSTNSCTNADTVLNIIFSRFRNVADQLKRRHDNRPVFEIKDEYDTQDLLHALLCLYFDDIRPEEWTPSYAGSSSRVDFFIPEIETVIEVKKTRTSLMDKDLTNELIIDIERYQKMEKCKKLYCFVYNPDRLLNNPTAIKKDLEDSHNDFVNVFISS